MVKITLGIDGMVCGMCEAHINDAVRKAFPIKKIDSSHKKKQTVIISEQILDEQSIKAVIESTGYRMVSYQCENYQKKRLFSFGRK